MIMNDIDTRINNLNNFYHWCASRVLSLDRKYAKEILNSIGVPQAVKDLYFLGRKSDYLLWYEYVRLSYRKYRSPS